MYPRLFTPEMLTETPPAGWDVRTRLAHFAIITYWVEPDSLRPHIPDRFALDCVPGPDGLPRALISVVPFIDEDFHFVRFPWLKWRFGQTNYRAYVTDTKTGEHVVWFFGTSLDSFWVMIPQYAWKLPWHRADIVFDTQYDSQLGRYTKYRLETRSRWAPTKLVLDDLGREPKALGGFPTLESGLVWLTHPLRGFYYRRDRKIGGYTVWHDRLKMNQGRAVQAEFPLLAQLGLVQVGELSTIHSVLILPETRFTVYLPPEIV